MDWMTGSTQDDIFDTLGMEKSVIFSNSLIIFKVDLKFEDIQKAYQIIDLYFTYIYTHKIYFIILLYIVYTLHILNYICNDIFN